MLLATGTKVRLKHTGDEAVVIELLGQGMVKVRIEDGEMEIPVSENDLERIEMNKTVKAKIVKGKQTPVVEKPIPVIDSQYTILNSFGIQLAFDPVEADGQISHYEMYLINDTSYDVIFGLDLNVSGFQTKSKHGKLKSVSIEHVGILRFDQLNDQPIVDIDCRQLTTEGSGHKFQKQIKIKAQQFFKNQRTAPLLNKLVHWYLVIENFDAKVETPKEDLKCYTLENLELKKSEPEAKFVKVNVLDLQERAAFVNEIDLHIEKLTKRHKKLTAQEKLYLQLSHFDDFIERALRHGIDRVYIIHGIGKGRLKEEIANRLRSNSHVTKFVNEFHVKYGYGATEVHL